MAVENADISDKYILCLNILNIFLNEQLAGAINALFCGDSS